MNSPDTHAQKVKLIIITYARGTISPVGSPTDSEKEKRNISHPS